jgi:dTDP-L-rhamnose 4-epimerase
MNILITGGAGFIGSHTADALLKKGHQVKILDILKKPIHLNGFPEYLDRTKVEFIFGDVTNKTTMTYALSNVDIVFHLAAYQDYLPDYSSFSIINVTSTSLIYEIIEEYNLPVKKVVLASSQAVMGEGRYLTQEGKAVFPSLRTITQLDKGKWDILDTDTNLPLIMDLSDEGLSYDIIKFGNWIFFRRNRVYLYDIEFDVELDMRDEHRKVLDSFSKENPLRSMNRISNI